MICAIPVLPSADIDRDIDWHGRKIGVECIYNDKMYVVLQRFGVYIHLQWHPNTPDDQLPGGSVVRIYAKNIKLLFEEFIERNTVTRDKFATDTPWERTSLGSMTCIIMLFLLWKMHEL